VRFYFCSVLILLCSFAFSFAGKAKIASPDPDYVLALSVADHFLQAWESRDYEAGVVMLTDVAKQGISESQLDELFGAEKSGSRGFEVAHGKKLHQGRYEFPVVLFEGAKAKNAASRFSRLVVVREGKNEWVIDQLP
jgi:hypothetical protein